MPMIKFIKRVSATAATAVMIAGGSASASSISNTGPFSNNQIWNNNTYTVTKTNTNNVGVNNFNLQFAKSGDANVKYNTFGGSATSGAATNWNANNTWISIHN